MKTKEELEQLAESKFGTEIDSIRGSKPYDLEADRKNGYVQGYQDAQEQDNWISVRDRLPKDTDRYLCFMKDDDGIEYQTICRFDCESKHFHLNNIDNNFVTHWQPLLNQPNTK